MIVQFHNSYKNCDSLVLIDHTEFSHSKVVQSTIGEDQSGNSSQNH